MCSRRAATLGLAPRQISTGDRTILGKISKHGNRYLRVLFVQAAWVVLIRPQSWERYGLKPWIDATKKRLHRNVLAIALANAHRLGRSQQGAQLRMREDTRDVIPCSEPSRPKVVTKTACN